MVQVPLVGDFEGPSTLRGPHVKPPPGPPVRCRPTGQVQYAPICGVLWAFYKTPTAQPTRNLRVADIAMAQGDTALKVAWKNVEQGRVYCWPMLLTSNTPQSEKTPCASS